MGVFEVNAETKKLTKKCLYNFECLNNNDWNTCSIKTKLGENGLEIKDKCNKENCSYAMTFGYSLYLCHCPVRAEIHLAYNM